MEMSPNTASTALLPWSLCVVFLLTSESQMRTSASTDGSSQTASSMLLFDSGSPVSSLRNCSCSAPIGYCDEALANSLCRCNTVLRSSVQRLQKAGLLTVWVKELWVLEELLNSSMVAHLKLSFCGMKHLQSQQLVLLGLQTLRIHSAAPESPHPDQELQVVPSAGTAADLESSSFHVTFIDVSVLNGLTALKAYSVVGLPPPTFFQNFPHLDSPFTQLFPTDPNDPVDSREKPSDPRQTSLITFVY
uniref:Chromosome 21 open reading frame 62 n=1 Tax=Nothobranchius pienaari TaxID=704102 RepID=A0A1A8R6V5_9TELE